VPYYDYMDQYPSSYFADTSHMNVAGRTSFSWDMAQLIKTEAGN
jgi:hypothetical protein